MSGHFKILHLQTITTEQKFIMDKHTLYVSERLKLIYFEEPGSLL